MASADLKSHLKKIEGGNSSNLYDHLSKVFTKLLLENPRNAYDSFEDYSYNVKFNGFKYKTEADNANRMKETYEEMKDYEAKCRQLLDKINVGTPEDPAEPGPTGYVPNILEESKWFEWAGVYFGEEESYQIFKSLTKLSVSKQLKQVRFWGKILCSVKDYYVAEGILEGGDDQEYPPDVETKGQGVNKLNYWVITDLLHDEWKELPVITPEQIKIARKIKHIFSGNLEANIVTNPFFFGKEKHLLKAQIVRISHSTTLIPKGMYTVNADEPREIELTEEYKLPNFNDLKSTDMWVHHPQNILKEGRLVHFKPEFGPDDNEEEIMKEKERKDPFEPRLKPVSQDIPVGTLESAWKIRTCGDPITYDQLGFTKSTVNNGYILIKSLNWPGAMTLFHNKVWTQIYVGYGFKHTEEFFFPKQPQKVLAEPDDIDEQPEPNFPVQQNIAEERPKSGPHDDDE